MTSVSSAHVLQPAVGVLRVLADDRRTASQVGSTAGLPAMLAAQLGAFRDQEVSISTAVHV